MYAKGLLLRVLLNRSQEGKVLEASLSKTLPQQDKEAVLQLSVTDKNIDPLINQFEKTLSQIHYSWVFEYIQGMEKSKRPLFLACLEDEARVKLSKMLHEKPPRKITWPLLKKFTLQKLASFVSIEAKMPAQYLAENRFSSLLALSKNQLVNLMDLLGMYDLASEMKKMVATKSMKSIYSCVPASMIPFLRICLHQKDKIVTPPLHLEKLGGDCKKLMALLHHRGMTRLALALVGQDTDFIWYLCHRLDTGRGKLLQKQIEKAKPSNLTEIFALQVESAKKFLTQEKKVVERRSSDT